MFDRIRKLRTPRCEMTRPLLARQEEFDHVKELVHDAFDHAIAARSLAEVSALHKTQVAHAVHASFVSHELPVVREYLKKYVDERVNGIEAREKKMLATIAFNESLIVELADGITKLAKLANSQKST